MAVLCVAKYQGSELSSRLSAAAVPHAWLDSKMSKGSYDPATDQVAVLTIHSSKGLEFPRVIIVGIGQLSDSGERQQQDARLLYVGMTRAQQCLLMTTSAKNDYSRRLMLAASAQQGKKW